ncbi:MAG: glycosyltransferase, partial [Rubrivivax sp.]|nr:glycosyltransferase [Rubrivivax sp.]
MATVTPLFPPVRVAVVVPTYRRPQLLRRCLLALLAQRLPADAYEIVVVDDGRDDATRDLVRQLGGRPPAARQPLLRYLRPARGRGPAQARNIGWRNTMAPLVAFTD